MGREREEEKKDKREILRMGRKIRRRGEKEINHNYFLIITFSRDEMYTKGSTIDVCTRCLDCRYSRAEESCDA